MRITARLAIWILAGICLTTAQAGETYRISGVVVHGVTGQRLSQVRVLVAPDDGSSKEIDTTTGTDGQFAFDRLPAGSWTLSAERKGFVRQNFGERAIYGAWASSVVTGPKGASENLTFQLNPPAAIRGKVTDENGEPVPGAHLQLLVRLPGPRNQFQVRKAVATDDIGEYRMSGLPAVLCYLIAVVPLPVGGSGFALQYYPNVTDPRAATAIQLKSGEDFTADYILRKAHGVSVELEGSSGIADGNGSELLLLITQGPQGSEVSAGTLVPGTGRTFFSVPPGRYKLVIGDVRSTYATSKWIEVGSEDLTVKLPFPDPPLVTAKVRVVDGDATLLKKAMLRLHTFADAGNNSRPLGPDGTAVFPGEAAGRYIISLSSSELYVKSVTARNAQVVDGLVDLPESGPVQLEIVAAGDGAHVKGKVQSDGKPVCGALVVLAPARPSVNADDYRGYQSDSDGSFDFSSIKPGDYIIFATNEWRLEYGNPAAIEKYLARGKRVKAEPNGSIDLLLDPLSR